MNKDFCLKVLIILFLVISVAFSTKEIFPAMLMQKVVIFLPMTIFMIYAAYNPTTQSQKIMKQVVFILLLLCLWLFHQFAFRPAKLTNEEAQYMSHFNAGYACFQKRNLKCALEEYQMAEALFDTDEELYVRKAWVYERMNEYEKAIESMNQALKCDNKASIYKKANGFRFISNDISIYTTLGDSYYALKKYKEAKEAYNYVVEHVTYQYSDIYFKRGLAEYYLGEKENALQDFYKHREVIDTYLYDQSNSEYPAKYPTYNQRNIDNVNGWIRATMAL